MNHGVGRASPNIIYINGVGKAEKFSSIDFMMTRKRVETDVFVRPSSMGWGGRPTWTRGSPALIRKGGVV